MKYWINKDTSSNNVVVLAKTGVLVASCAEEACDGIDKKLNEKISPLSLFAKDDVDVVKFTQIRRILSRSTDDEVEIVYSEKKETETICLSFADAQAKKNFITVLEKILPENLQKSEYQQSALAAILPPLGSAIAAGCVSYFYINKLRWVTIIVGGLWLALSLYMLVTRLQKPPVITRWSTRGQYTKKAIGGIKAVFSYVVVAAIIIGVSSRLPLTHGKSAIYDQIDRYELTASEVEQLVDNGADPNYHPQDGSESPLHIAVYRDESELVSALLAHGADPLTLNSEGYTALEAAVMYADVVMLNAVLKDIKSVDDNPKLMEAVVYNSIDIEQLSLLQSVGFDVHQQDQQGKNLLQLAIEEYASYDAIAYLIGLDLSRDFTIEGKTPVNYLEESDRPDMARLFQDGGSAITIERSRELQELLDQFVISESKAAIQNTGKAGRLIIALADLDDEEWNADEYRENVYTRLMMYKRSDVVLAAYGEACSHESFSAFPNLQEEIKKRKDSRQKYVEAIDWLIERDQAINLDGENRLPSDLIASYEDEAEALHESLTENEQTLTVRCQQQLDKLVQASANVQ